jgi:hypothetical protein
MKRVEGRVYVHLLKTWPSAFEAVINRRKHHEYRRDDRDPRFAVGDELHLREWVPDPDAVARGVYELGKFTGREHVVIVSHITRPEDGFGVPGGYCVMSIEELG